MNDPPASESRQTGQDVQAIEAPSEDTDSNPPVILGPREQLFHLLAEAAEIEHTLMCSYLYLCFSLKASSAEFSKAEAEAVARWRDVVRGIAIEEMTHLLIVANLSIAIGGRPHFGRPNFPVAPGYFPSGVVVKLTPFSMETLEHVIYLERPRGVELEDGASFVEEDYSREEAYHGLMPSVQDYATVGDLYDALRENLKATSHRLGESTLFIGPTLAQVSEEASGVAGVVPIATLQEALQAIDTVVEQGEGTAGDREDSHFARFRMMREEYAALLASNPKFEPAWPVAWNPVMRRPPEPEDKVFIDHPRAAPTLDLANALYSVLLRLLVQAFGRQGADAGDVQRRYLAAAVELMHGLAQMGTTLATLPGSRAAPHVHAGMTFTMLRSVEPLLQGRAERVLIEERLEELRAGVEALPRGSSLPEGLRSRLNAARKALGYTQRES